MIAPRLVFIRGILIERNRGCLSEVRKLLMKTNLGAIILPSGEKFGLVHHMGDNVEFRLPVLLVDDEPKLLTSVSILLRSSGIESVDTLEDSRGVIPWLQKHPNGVLILDLTMPHLSGQEVLDQVSAKTESSRPAIFSAINLPGTPDALWIDLAINSLPVPVSPVISTGCGDFEIASI